MLPRRAEARQVGAGQQHILCGLEEAQELLQVRGVGACNQEPAKAKQVLGWLGTGHTEAPGVQSQGTQYPLVFAEALGNVLPLSQEGGCILQGKRVVKTQDHYPAWAETLPLSSAVSHGEGSSPSGSPHSGPGTRLLQPAAKSSAPPTG